MQLQSRLTVFIAIGSMLALMGGIVYYASLDNTSLESVEFLSGSVRIASIDTIAERARIEVTFNIRNPSDVTFTIPEISYEIGTGQEKIVSGKYSTADIAMPGRVVFSTNELIPLKSITHMIKSDANAAIYDRLLAGQIDNYVATGTVVVESAWSIIERGFEVELESQS